MLTITTSRARLLTRSDDVNCAYCKAICEEQQQEEAQPQLVAEVEPSSASSRPNPVQKKKLKVVAHLLTRPDDVNCACCKAI
jgi:hypothetical protein